MKTTDSVMREIKDICTYHGEEGTSGYCLSNEQFDKLEALYSHSLAEARREEQERILTMAHNIRSELKEPGYISLTRLEDLLTGDNPEEAKI